MNEPLSFIAASRLTLMYGLLISAFSKLLKYEPVEATVAWTAGVVVAFSRSTKTCFVFDPLIGEFLVLPDNLADVIVLFSA